MKRVLLAIVVAAVLFAAVYAAAAGVDFDAGTLQAGIDTDLQCQERPLMVLDYTYDHVGNLGNPMNDLALNSVQLGYFEQPCAGAEVRLTLYNEAGDRIGEATEFVNWPVETVWFDLNPGPGPEGPPIYEIYSIGVVLEAPGPTE
jgi:opacity protein-like surface antigen